MGPVRGMSKPERFFEEGAKIYDKNLQITYQIKSFLGRGAFAQCYLVTIDSGAEFALKIVSLHQDESVLKKIDSEISIHRTLDHPHIVRMYAEFRDTNYVYMVLELCTNKTLSELLKKRTRLDRHYTVKYVNQLVEALSYLHETANVIHRDLKLGNLFLDCNFNLKIGDFGLAARVRPGQKKNTICGTPNYIAPEVLFDKENGHSYEVDIWGLGVIIYTMLVGTPPFQKKNVKEIYRNIQQNRYTYPADIEIPEEARRLIDSILTPNPLDRLSLTEIKNHPFLQTSLSLPEKVLRNIQEFCYTEEPCREDHLIFSLHSQRLGGLGYILKSGPGILFNDGTTLLSKRRSIVFIDVIRRNGKRFYKKEEHLFGRIPEFLNDKFEKLSYFVKHFVHHLPADVEPTFVVKVKKTSGGCWFQLWNGILVFEQGDRRAVVFQEGRKVQATFKNEICKLDGEMKAYIIEIVSQYVKK